MEWQYHSLAGADWARHMAGRGAGHEQGCHTCIAGGGGCADQLKLGAGSGKLARQLRQSMGSGGGGSGK